MLKELRKWSKERFCASKEKIEVLKKEAMSIRLKQPAEMKDDVWKTMQKKASSTIRLALAPEIKYSV
ncbi:hypothetical protein Tco_1205255, partial [Tanacetum coccineum]